MLGPTTILAPALRHLPRAPPRLPFEIEMVSRLRKQAEVKDAIERSATEGGHPARHPPAGLPRRPSEGPRPADRGRGAALRGEAEGAAAPAEAEGGRPLAVGDTDSADAADVARGPARHLGDRDAARGPPARSAPSSAPTTRSWSDVRSGAGRRGGGVLPPQPDRVAPGDDRAPRALCRASGSPRRTGRWTSSTSRRRCSPSSAASTTAW